MHIIHLRLDLNSCCPPIIWKVLLYLPEVVLCFTIITRFITFTDKNRGKKIKIESLGFGICHGSSQSGGPDLTTIVRSHNFSWMGLFVSISLDPSQAFLMATSPLLSTPNSKSPHLRLHPLIATPQISF